ncbi:hypothetical protein [Iamia sp.]|uniref:hypothetical protein n=1 Tax=Iamia sp. TaxID=2722710 RepID=UPI002CFFD48E|nr:hypothetical protein [Iamia sp.]HXH59544.1 hypothetical protein [Iamia sp.]
MIIVDDRMAREVLSGRRHPTLGDQPVATTWGFHYRLLRALSDNRVDGRLSRSVAKGLRATAVDPPTTVLEVLDPRLTTHAAARLSIDHRLNLLSAGLVAAAQHHGAPVVLSAGNVGRTWPDLFASLSIPLSIV